VYKKKPISTGKKKRRIILLVGLLIAGAITLALGVTALQIVWLRDHDPKRTSWMKLREAAAKEAGKPFTLKYSFVPLRRLPRAVPRAVIAAEDADFYKHDGFDWEAIRKAYKLNEKSGKIKRGGSTITQQLAKNLYLTPRRSYIRKARESVITWFLEKLLSKDRILELYLNVIEFGPGVFGVEEAAKEHFGIAASRLTLDQACRLAAIIPSPLKYKVTGEYVRKRAERIARAVGR